MTYGDASVVTRAIEALLRQVRELNELVERETGYEDEEQAARARIAEIDGLLAEIAAVTQRTDEPDLESGG